MPVALDDPLTLPCGAVLKNRIAKAAMTEGLADPMNRATARHATLYRRWAEGGPGLSLTGNVQVDRRYLERPGNVVIDGNDGLDELRAYASAGTADDTHLWMQIGHAGRQTPRHVNPEPVAPSALPLKFPEAAFGKPRALSAEEVEDVVRRFVHVAGVARAAGFTGVQIHSAHGYLLSEFLSPLANQREDRWGGSLENRARLLLEIVRATRAEVGADFPISVKLNSSDFQKGGFSHDDCLRVVAWLEDAGVDLLEISGGTYEQPSMMGARLRDSEAEPRAPKVRESTLKREAYFLDYARNIRAASKIPLMVTGGFRRRQVMDAVLADGELDVVGIARPLCVETDLPRRLLDGTAEAGGSYEKSIDPPQAGLAWFCLQLFRLADGLEADTALTGEEAATAYRESERQTTERLEHGGARAA